MKHKLTILPIPLPVWLTLIDNLTAEETRAFTFLIATYCRDGFLPNDDRALAQIARVRLRTWLKMRPRIALKFPREGWVFPEIDQAIERRIKLLGKRSRAGVEGNFKRWHGMHGKHDA